MKNWPKIFYTVGGKIIFRTCSPFQNIPLRALETLMQGYYFCQVKGRHPPERKFLLNEEK